MTATSTGPATRPRADLADGAARSAITEQTRSTLFVAAGAGSGKTTALVQRILTLVLVDGFAIERIAAVTFTERAAADLRDRVRLDLESALRDPGTDAERAQRARAALDGLDLAAIGTLHAFAQRILTRHAIEAGIPPALRVLDGMGASVAAQQRWSSLWSRLAEDDEIAGTLDLALDLGITTQHLRDLVERLDAHPDLVAAHLQVTTASTLPETDLGDLARRAEELARNLPSCLDGGDPLALHLEAFEQWARSAPDAALAVDARVRLDWFRAAPRKAHGRTGSKTRWDKGFDLAGLREEAIALSADITAAREGILDAVLRGITDWLGRAVLDIAANRRAEGELTFSDLLVLSRDLLRADPEVRASLQERYPRILLDEFQDTDPLQIEIALRIAGGAGASQERWQDIEIPPGSLFVVGDPKQSIYRFRRADISLYLEAQRVLGGHTSLTTNFRSLTPLITWVNAVFGGLVVGQEGVQPDYEPLTPHRDAEVVGPVVAVLGDEAHADADGIKVSAKQVQAAEAADIAATVVTALDEGWTVTERTLDGEISRPVRLGDITLLVPARTTLGGIERALDDAGIAYRTEATSLVHAATEVRALLATARAIADPSDRLALVTALRSPLFGIDDRELYEHHRAGGGLSVLAPRDAGAADGPVSRALADLRDLHDEIPRRSPSELLGLILERRRSFEIGTDDGPRARDAWRRLRYVVEQAREWTESEHGSLRGYLDWAQAQASGADQAAESVLPETDTDGIRITTIHASKGLDFPMVILAGLGSTPRSDGGVTVHWTDGGSEVSIRKELATTGAASAREREAVMSDAEHVRLLYVAATRARDHLVVSLHRKFVKPTVDHGLTRAERIHRAGGAEHGAVLLERPGGRRIAAGATAGRPVAPEDLGQFEERLRIVRDHAARVWSTSASSLEGGEDVAGPDVASTTPAGAPSVTEAGAATLDLGSRGAAVGDAVHGVLHVAALDPSADIAGAVRARCEALGVTDLEAHVALLARSALEHPLVAEAAAGRHWREAYVGALAPGATDSVRDGIIDLLFEDADGSLVVVDYKTDHVPVAALGARTAFYRPQVREYVRLVEATTGRRVGRAVLLFLAEGGADAREVSLDPS